MSSRPGSSLPPAIPIRLLLVNSNQLVIWALEKLAERAESGIAIVGKVDTAGESAPMARQIRPDVVVIGLGLGTAAVNVIPKLAKPVHADSCIAPIRSRR
jgi:DNA-binding NarL/FixJ family response regulator